MGEIAEMMLEGLMCEGCGEFMEDMDEPGFPRRCAGCQPDAPQLDGNHRPVPGHPVRGGTRPAPPKQWRWVSVPGYIKVNCPDCNAKVKAVGLDDHMRTKHSTAPNGGGK